MVHNERTHSSLADNESNNIREDAGKQLMSGQISVEEYTTIILNNPLKFTSATRPVPILRREANGIRIVGSELKKVELKNRA